MTVQPQVDDWRAGLSEILINEILEAIDQFEFDAEYEKCGPTVQGSIQHLSNLSDQLLALKTMLERLSPVAEALLYETNLDMVTVAGDDAARALLERIWISDLVLIADRLSRVAQIAQERLPEMHSPLTELAGQGSGSARGRVSDLQAVQLFPETLRGLRSPKDKFAVRVLMALAKHLPRERIVGRGSRVLLREFMDQVWLEKKLPDQNWERVLEQRGQILRWVEEHGSSPVWPKIERGD